MAYTAQKLIVKSLYRAGICSQGFRAPTDVEINEGLDSLNDLFAEKTVDNALNPYYTEYPLTVSVGVESYFIPNLIEIETITFNLNAVRYGVRKTGRQKYFGSPRANNIKSLPFSWHLERELGGARLFLYWLPDQAYDFKLWAQFSLGSENVLTTDLSLTYDRFYIAYLKNAALPERLCLDFDMDLPGNVQRSIDYYQGLMSKQISPMDLSMQKCSTLGRGLVIDYFQYANLGNGYVPTGGIF